MEKDAQDRAQLEQTHGEYVLRKEREAQEKGICKRVYVCMYVYTYVCVHVCMSHI
jgi:hypothetical protein